MREFEVEGKVTTYVRFEVEAESEEEAKLKATEEIKDYLRLDTQGSMVDKSTIDDLYVWDENEEDENL